MVEVDVLMRLIALIHDGDCSDCSCIHLAVSESLDIEAERIAYQRWYREVYATQPITSESRTFAIGYQSFADWLVSKGATYETEIEEVDA